METCSCESVPRHYLGKKDMFFQDGIIFDLDPAGRPITKKFGREQKWKFLPKQLEHIFLF